MRRLLWIIPLVAIVAIFIATTAVYSPRGVTAVIQNKGTTTMCDLYATVSGQSYFIGDLAPGESRSVRLQPDGESSIFLGFADPDGVARQLDADCYFEQSGYSGTITIEVTDGCISKVDDQIQLSWW